MESKKLCEIEKRRSQGPTSSSSYRLIGMGFQALGGSEAINEGDQQVAEKLWHLQQRGLRVLERASFLCLLGADHVGCHR